MKKLQFFSFLMVFGLIFSMLPSHANAQSLEIEGTYELTFAELGPGEITLRGVYPSYTLFLPFPEQWQVTDIVLNLQINFSAQLRDDATLNVEVDGIPIASSTLNSLGQNATWNIPIPAELIEGKEGISIKLLSYLRVTTTDICQDASNPATWVRVGSRSRIMLNYNKINQLPDLSTFPHPFIQNTGLSKDRILLAVASDASAAETSSAAYLSSVLGARASWRGLELIISTIDSLTEFSAATYQVVLVGTQKKLMAQSAINAFLPTELKNLNTDTGVIYTMPSPWGNEKALLVVSGESEIGLDRAIKALTNKAFAKLARGNLVLISSDPEDASTQEQNINWKNITLTNLGYSDQIVSGVGKHIVRVEAYLQPGSIPNQAVFHVIFSHSPFISTDRAYLTLWANKQPVSGIYLSEKNEQRSSWDVTIPVEDIEVGLNVFEFIFDLQLQDEARCDEFYFDKAWASLHAESALEISPSTNNIRPTLDGLPVPFGDAALVILPENPSEQEKAAVFQVLKALGQLLGERVANLNILSANTVTPDQLKNSHLILIGHPQTNPLIDEVLKQAPIQIDSKGRKITSDVVKLELIDYTKVGMIEVLPSPWNNAFSVMLVTGTDDESVGFASNMLVNDANRARLTGDVAILDGNGNLTSFDSHAAEKTPGVTLLNKPAGFKLEYVIYALIAVSVLASSVAAVALWRRKQKTKV